jgi:hypothetical protein
VPIVQDFDFLIAIKMDDLPRLFSTCSDHSKNHARYSSYTCYVLSELKSILLAQSDNILIAQVKNNIFQFSWFVLVRF